MLNRIRDRFGTAGLVVSIMALVLALAGGAFAASGGLNAKQKKQVKAIAKSFQGTGPAGAKGDTGAAGGAGGAGQNGASVTGVAATVGECPTGGVKYTSASGDNVVCNGAAGGPGTSVTNTAIVANPANVNCKEGGAKFNVGAGADTFACTGSPWTAGGTLPPGATETGSVAGVSQTGFAGALTNVPISFPIPLVGARDQDHVFVIYLNAAVPSACQDAVHAGAASAANPEASSGNLCVYLVSDASESTIRKVIPAGGTSSTNGASTAGAYLQLAGGEAGWPFNGTWAVTG